MTKDRHKLKVITYTENRGHSERSETTRVTQLTLIRDETRKVKLDTKHNIQETTKVKQEHEGHRGGRIN